MKLTHETIVFFDVPDESFQGFVSAQKKSPFYRDHATRQPKKEEKNVEATQARRKADQGEDVT